jgi:hypothetical protein
MDQLHKVEFATDIARIALMSNGSDDCSCRQWRGSRGGGWGYRGVGGWGYRGWGWAGATLAGAVIGGAIASNAYGIMVVRITVARITRATAILRAASSRRTIMYRPPAIMFRLTGPTTTDIRGGLGATGKSSDLTPSLTTRSDRLERAPQADLRGTKIVLCAVRTRPRSRYPRLSPLVLAGCSRRHLFAD